MFFEYESLIYKTPLDNCDSGSKCSILKKCSSVNDLRKLDKNLLLDEKNKFVDLTRKKLKTLLYTSSTNDNCLRNKVLLESALKKILDNHECENNDNYKSVYNDDIIDIDFNCDNQTTNTNTNNLYTSQTPLSSPSPRKRCFSSSSAVDPVNDLINPKRLRTFYSTLNLFNDNNKSLNEITDDIHMKQECDDYRPDREELFTNLATFFHRLKTQH